MIAELLTTIIMALGVATGNVSSNSYKGGNAFNNVEKATKPIQKSVEEELYDTYSSYLAGQVENQETGEPTFKYYIIDANDWRESPNINTGYYNIYNTTYVFSRKTSQDLSIRYIMFYEFTPYYNYNNETTTIKQYATAEYVGSYSWVTVYFDNWTASDEILNYIDMTLTNNTRSILLDYINNGTKIDRYQETVYDSRTQNYYNYNLENEYRITGLQRNEKVYAVITTLVNIDISGGQQVTYFHYGASEFGIRGTVIIPEINYEVVDIPNLMYTILTMPFSFISTAFNLTIFPGTPYALNFGNLFLTILAVFILMWLLNKVFK